ncbi:MAG: hypothetical protein ACTS6J_24285, partial [Burkholderiales bacterium]
MTQYGTTISDRRALQSHPPGQTRGAVLVRRHTCGKNSSKVNLHLIRRVAKTYPLTSPGKSMKIAILGLGHVGSSI